MSVGDVCNREVVIVNAGESVMDAVHLMRKHHVGDVVVVEDSNGRKVPKGILTDRDIVIEIIAENVDLASVRIGDVMSFELLAVHENDEIMDAIKSMRAKGVRRAPVVNDKNELQGILAVDDLIGLITDQLTDVVRLVTREQQREREKRPVR